MDALFDIMIVLIKIMIFLGLFFPLYLLDKKTKERVKKLDEEIKNNQKLYEKNEIIKSKIDSNEDRDLDITGSSIKSGVLIVAITLLSGAALIYAINNFDLSLNTIYFILICIFSFLVISFIWVGVKTNSKYKKIIFEFSKNKYGIVEKISKPSTKIVKREKSEVHNIRHKYTFSYKITKYNCILSNYHAEILDYIDSGVGLDRNRYYSYKKIANIMEYCYNLNDLGIKNIDKNILINSDIKQAIEELAETKIIKASIKDECLVVEKETVFNNYSSEDAKRDVNDVELFYNKFVKVIIGNKNNI